MRGPTDPLGPPLSLMTLLAPPIQPPHKSAASNGHGLSEFLCTCTCSWYVVLCSGLPRPNLSFAFELCTKKQFRSGDKASVHVLLYSICMFAPIHARISVPHLLQLTFVLVTNCDRLYCSSDPKYYTAYWTTHSQMYTSMSGNETAVNPVCIVMVGHRTFAEQ